MDGTDNYTYMVYDGNRLISVSDGDTLVVTYMYDARNHRIKKTVGDETRLYYFNQQWQCVEERVGTTVDATWIYGLRYIDDVVCRVKNTEVLYALQDPNWNVVALVTPSGSVAERMTYDSFGRVTFRNASFVANVSQTTSSYNWTKTFTGQTYDVESGLMLYRNRYYHPGLGRFLTRDPIGYNANDVNLYRYVKNSVTISADPSGFQGTFEWSPAPPPPLKAGECFFRVCVTPVAAVGGHSFIVLYEPDGTWRFFRGGPSNNYNPGNGSSEQVSSPGIPDASGMPGTLLGTSGPYAPGSVDYPKEPGEIPNCTDVTVPCQSVKTLSDCFDEVINRVNNSHIKYVPVPPAFNVNQGNCNTLTTWMQKMCTGQVKFPISTQLTPGKHRGPLGILGRIHPNVRNDFPDRLLPQDREMMR